VDTLVLTDDTLADRVAAGVMETEALAEIATRTLVPEALGETEAEALPDAEVDTDGEVVNTAEADAEFEAATVGVPE
jgi:hypothetical protein